MITIILRSSVISLDLFSHHMHKLKINKTTAITMLLSNQPNNSVYCLHCKSQDPQQQQQQSRQEAIDRWFVEDVARINEMNRWQHCFCFADIGIVIIRHLLNAMKTTKTKTTTVSVNTTDTNNNQTTVAVY